MPIFKKKEVKRIHEMFPFFDDNALDAARFYFGTKEPQVMFWEGERTVDELFLLPGNRNAALSQKAGKLIKRYGDTDEAVQRFQAEAAKCVPPLEKDELDSIWNSAKKFGKRVAAKDGYITPEQYNKSSAELARLHPENNSRY